MEILERVYFHNTVLDYLIALAIILIGLAFVRVLRNSILGRLKKWSAKTSITGDDFVLTSIERFGIPALYYFIVYAGLNYLTLTEKAERVIAIATSLVVTFFMIRLFSSTIMMLLRSHIRKQEHGQEKLNQLGGLMILINIVVWMVGLVFLIDNLGYDVTTIIAGLGIGGIAIALAAQNILGDLFNYFVIFFDRPFEVGDFIIVDDKLGAIEYIGLKTTRVRSLSGEELIIGNANLTSSRIHNYKRMNRRRVVFTIDVAYGTPLERIKETSALLRTIVERRQQITFDRAHFVAYREWSLRFEVVYYVLSPDYNVYMDIHQQINLEIYEEFKKRDIEFALPFQYVFLKNNEGLAPQQNAERSENRAT